MSLRMVLQAFRDSGEACSKGGLRLERLWISWKALGHKSPPDTSKCKLVCALLPVLVSSQPSSSLPFFFFFSVSISLQRLIYPSICIPGIQARDTGYNCILVSCHSVTDKKVRFLLCVVWVSLLIHTSELGQLWAAITLPDVRFTRWLTQVPENDPPQFLHPGPALCFWQHGTHQMRGKRRVATLTLTIHI